MIPRRQKDPTTTGTRLLPWIPSDGCWTPSVFSCGDPEDRSGRCPPRPGHPGRAVVPCRTPSDPTRVGQAARPASDPIRSDPIGVRRDCLTYDPTRSESGVAGRVEPAGSRDPCKKPPPGDTNTPGGTLGIAR